MCCQRHPGRKAMTFTVQNEAEPRSTPPHQVSRPSLGYCCAATATFLVEDQEDAKGVIGQVQIERPSSAGPPDASQSVLAKKREDEPRYLLSMRGSPI